MVIEQRLWRDLENGLPSCESAKSGLPVERLVARTRARELRERGTSFLAEQVVRWLRQEFAERQPLVSALNQATRLPVSY
jgi:hypothetical protein